MSSLTLTAALVAGEPQDPLQQGFDDMYNLMFDAAHQRFQSWEAAHPSDPRGPVFDAAAYLFSEFDRLKILQSEFFLDNSNFGGSKRLTPDARTKLKFEDALRHAHSLADGILRTSPGDQNALFANVLRLGLHADYTALIDKSDLAALSDIKEARQTAQSLLDRHPDYYDAYIAQGVENYLLSQKPAPVRWILHFGGAQTDKDAGIAKLRLTAAKGKYLQPYAELLLAVAALRDKDKVTASRLLSDLAERFPHNSLYQTELKKISASN